MTAAPLSLHGRHTCPNALFRPTSPHAFHPRPPTSAGGPRPSPPAAGAARAPDRGIDPMPAVRLFTPDAHATWLLAPLDPDDGGTAWGLIDLGIGLPTLGTVKLSDLASIVGPSQHPVMRDLYFLAERPLSEYVRLAQENGAITD